MKSDIINARAQEAILRSSGHSVKLEKSIIFFTRQNVGRTCTSGRKRRGLKENASNTNHSNQQADDCFDQLWLKINRESEADKQKNIEMKQSATLMVWGGITGRGLTKLHMLPLRYSSFNLVKKYQLCAIALITRKWILTVLLKMVARATSHSLLR